MMAKGRAMRRLLRQISQNRRIRVSYSNRLKPFTHLASNKENVHDNLKTRPPVSVDREDSFRTLGLQQEIIAWLSTREITRMTRVQRLTIIPFLRGNKDVLVQSHTGSGKTLCFVVPMLELLLSCIKAPIQCTRMDEILDVYSMFLFPTRELAIQVMDVVLDALTFISRCDDERKTHTFKMEKWTIYCSLLIGGNPVQKDVKHIKNAVGKYTKCIVGATPGRLSHLLMMLPPNPNDIWDFRNLEMLVLDEADRLLELGFHDDIMRIVSFLPKKRKTGLFSATLGNAIVHFAGHLLSNSIAINADNEGAKETNIRYATPKGLNNFYRIIDHREKLLLIFSMLDNFKNRGIRKCAIFLLTCDMVDYYAALIKELLANGDSHVVIYKAHRKMSTKSRRSTVAKFKATLANNLQVLICTDLFSRGIDVPDIDWVIQFDPPQDPNFFVHRVGRVSRAGKVGNALLLLRPSEEAYIEFQKNRNISLHLLENLPECWDCVPSYTDSVVKGDEIPYTEFLKNTKPLDICLYDWSVNCKLLSFLRSRLCRDRILLDAASRAFVSYVRAYSEHHLKSIFNKNLDYGGLAASFGLLRVPRVKEILGHKLENFATSSVDPSNISYLDEERERCRLEKVKGRRAFLPAKAKLFAKTQVANKVRTKGEKRRAKRKIDYEEWESYRREEAMAKKLKRGRLQPDKYNTMLNVLGEIDGYDDWEEQLANFDSKALKRVVCGSGRRK